MVVELMEKEEEVGGSIDLKLMQIFIVLRCLITLGGGCVFLCVVPNCCVCRGVSVCGRNQNARK
jgi:hypothetical protein